MLYIYIYIYGPKNGHNLVQMNINRAIYKHRRPSSYIGKIAAAILNVPQSQSFKKYALGVQVDGNDPFDR